MSKPMYFVLWQHWSERTGELLGTDWEMPSESVRGTIQTLLALRLFGEGKTPERAARLIGEVPIEHTVAALKEFLGLEEEMQDVETQA